VGRPGSNSDPSTPAVPARPDQLRCWADLFAALGDPGRLLLLMTIHEAESISVSDLAHATGRSGTMVSHSLRVLRQRGLVTAHRQGRTVRYTIAHAGLVELLRGLGVPRQPPPGGPLRPGCQREQGCTQR
jgi:DNA-binding transcriptional ArsR family regulator